MPRKRAQILVADDHTLVAEAYKRILEPEYEVVGIVCDGRALLKAAAALHPQLILLDVAMPQLNGLDAAQQIKHNMPEIKLVFVTMNDDADLVAEAFRRGASAYLPKTCAAAELLVALREVSKGLSYLSPSIAKDTIGSLLRHEERIYETDRLTLRQREVMQLLAEGKSMKEAASHLNMTVRTVAFHKYRIMNVLQLHNSAELVQYAIRHHIIGA
jgi:DNA-binding NarL/FixJ family response regulator